MYVHAIRCSDKTHFVSTVRTENRQSYGSEQFSQFSRTVIKEKTFKIIDIGRQKSHNDELMFLVICYMKKYQVILNMSSIVSIIRL